MAIRESTLADLVGDLANPLPDPEFWRGRRVLLTGHTGFKGAWLAFWLKRMGAEVSGLALAPATDPSLYQELTISSLLTSQIGDIRQIELVKRTLADCQPEIVLHLAAQALVRASYREPLATFETNVLGTANVLEALRGMECVKVALMVTTDKVYRNQERMTPYPEAAELGGHDPYSASKAASELIIASYRDAFLSEQGVTVCVARAGNVIGGGDWAEDRLLPDLIRAWRRGEVVQIRRPDAVRPWQHVLEPLSAYLCLAQQAFTNSALASAWNIGPTQVASVRQVVQLARVGCVAAGVEFSSDDKGPHEAGLLALDVSKARLQLGIVPRWDLQTAVERSIGWYKNFADGVSAAKLCERDIDFYLSGEDLAKSQGICG